MRFILVANMLPLKTNGFTGEPNMVPLKTVG